MVTIRVNGKPQQVDVEPETPLLWVLRDTLGMTGTKFGCGMALCGACTVHLDGQADALLHHAGVRRGGQEGHDHRGRRRDAARQEGAGRLDRAGRAAVRLLPVRARSWARRRCSPQKPEPTDADIDAAMAGNICRCGTYPRIRAAIHKAAGPAGRRAWSHRSTSSRREFLKTGVAVAGGGLVLGVVLPDDAGRPARPRPAPPRCPTPGSRSAATTRITILSARSEMGQGVYTAMPTLVAEELEVDLREDQGRDRARRRALHQRDAGRPAHRRLDLGGARASTSSASRGRRRAACWSPPRRRSGASTPRGLPRPERRRCSGPAGQKATLRRAGRGGLHACRVPKDVKLKEPGRVALHRQAAESPRHAGQGQRHRRVRHRREAARACSTRRSPSAR